MMQIRVKNVTERNSVSGKKQIYVTSAKDANLIPNFYRMTPAWMIPEEKLILASVVPMDDVEVVPGYNYSDLRICGDFVSVIPEFSNRQPSGLCACKTPMTSDGFEVYCPNPQCPLSIVARVERLANTVFFPPEFTSYHNNVEHTSLSIGGSVGYYQPFAIIAEGSFYNFPGGDLDAIYLNFTDCPTLSTFLIQPLYQEFLEKFSPLDVLDNIAYLNINRFFDELPILINRRDYESDIQNHLMRSFLHALGLESVTPRVIDLILMYEKTMGPISSPFLCYAWCLTNISCMVNDMGLHRLEAQAIVQEMRWRGYEMFDIFFFYTEDDPDVKNIFKMLIV